jgi:hypothetical protein
MKRLVPKQRAQWIVLPLIASSIAIYTLLMMKVLIIQNGFDFTLLSHVIPMTSVPQKQNHDSAFPFSACLIVKDDNRILPEWLAYHYTVLPLRHLIVAIDPLSATSPLLILNKFRELGMNIIVWEDKDYINGNTAPDFESATPNTDKQKINRVFVHRQLIFYQQFWSLRTEKSTGGLS